MSLQDDDDAIIAKLRALPPEGQEPDWQKLEAAIRAQVGDRAPTVWWRNWKWIVPIWALATTAAVALIVLREHHDEAAPKHAVTVPHRDPDPVPTRTVTNAPTMWLDGEAVNVDDIDDTSLDSLDQAAREVLESDEVSLEELDDAALDRLEVWLDKERS